ncbi:MAG: hypothetical protein RBR35_15365, partial [Salinivirgaceae bacterium]|nr:hypothetical protein [Salinivirgaceae bacterium]
AKHCVKGDAKHCVKGDAKHCVSTGEMYGIYVIGIIYVFYGGCTIGMYGIGVIGMKGVFHGICTTKKRNLVHYPFTILPLLVHRGSLSVGEQ